MVKVLDNVKLYFSFLKASLKEMLIYRLDCIVGMVSQIVTQLVEIIFIWIVFQNTENLAGWNFMQVLLLYGITLISVGISDFCFDALYDIGPKYIREGDFDKIMLRPVHPLISIIGASKEFTALGYFGLGLAMTITMLIKLAIPITAILILKIVFFSIVGAAIIGAINTIFSIASFWTYRSNEIIWSFYRTYTFAQYPIDIYNKFIKVLITVILPFAFVAYYPTMDYLGINTYMIYLSPIIAIVLWIIAVKVWNFALNKYRSTGN
ncbi:MAG: ABC-2 family transporter protein [Clostridia bacterium]|nr:ABC-2 family transporter protein [Clostridia bacterium]HJJ16268.1 ABC-2 family transporter protein [Clostridiaceae bacterium]